MKKVLFNYLLALAFIAFNTNVFAQQPTVPATNVITVGKTTTSISINWTSGNGSNRIVTCALATSSAAVPTDGNAYTQNSGFGSGSHLGNGNYVIYNGSSYGCNAFGLTPGTSYRFRVFEYLIGVNGFDFSYENYLTSSYPTYTEYTLTTEPTINASVLNVSNIAVNSATLSFTSGNGTYDLLALRASSAYANTPIDGTNYSPSTAYGSGTSLTTSSPYSYVLSWGTLTTVNTTSLSPGYNVYCCCFCI